MAKEALIFDCDGVLVDSEILMVELEAKLLSEAGFRITADEIVERFVGRTYPDMLTEIGLQFGRTVGKSLANEIRQAAMAKLEADLFLHAAAALEVAPDRCLVIEDSPHGVEAAIAAGMTAVGLTAAGHARPSLTGRLLGAGATDVFDAVEQLGRSLR